MSRIIEPLYSVMMWDNIGNRTATHHNLNAGQLADIIDRRDPKYLNVQIVKTRTIFEGRIADWEREGRNV